MRCRGCNPSDVASSSANVCVYMYVFAPCAPERWNLDRTPCALCSLWTLQAFKTPGWWSVNAARPLRTCATTTHKSACTRSSISGPSFMSWRDTKRQGCVKFSRPHTHTQLVSLFLFSLCALFCFISDISTPIAQIFAYQTRHPSHLSWAETSCDHALGLLISDANLHLFSQRSKWSHLQAPLGDTPSCTAAWWREDSFCPPLILSLEHSRVAWLRRL